MLFTVIFLITILFFSLMYIRYYHFVNLFIYLFIFNIFLFVLHLPPRIARLIAGGEKYCKQCDCVNKVLLFVVVVSHLCIRQHWFEIKENLESN